MQAALKVLLQTLPGIYLRETRLRWRKRRAHRWLEALPVSVSRG